MDGSTLDVLIVDPTPERRLALCWLLREPLVVSCTVRELDCAAEALALCQVAPPDCVLLAASLSASTEPALLAALSAELHVPVVLLVSAEQEPLVLAALDQGAHDYLISDTLTPLRLQLTLQRTVASARLAQQHQQAKARLSSLLDRELAQASFEYREHKALASELRVLTKRLELLGEHAYDIIYRYRLTTPVTIEYVSPAIERMTGYPRELFYADPQFAFRLVHPDDLFHLYRYQAEAQTATSTFTLRWQHRDGTTRWAEMQRWIASHEEGETVVFEGIVRDITQRKLDELALEARSEALSRANAELARAVRLKDEFLAMMSHELRTPLNVVLGYTEALEEEHYGPLSEQQQHVLATIMQSGRHLLSMLSDILDLIHLEAGTELLELQPVDLDLLLRTVLQLADKLTKAKGIHLVHTLAHCGKELHADARRLSQILTNLLDNAVKFTPPGGTVGLEVRDDPEQGCVQFAIWDTGIGIADAELTRLFHPFTQVDGRLSRQYGGIGLGLTMVCRLVDMHGGSISLMSTPGQGSRFTVSLACATSDAAIPHGSLPDEELPPLEPARWVHPPLVLLADDHEQTLALYSEWLRREGCSVLTARTGEEVLAHVEAQPPDVVVIDLQMPELDGLSAIRHMRTEPRLDDMPIIALTALMMPGDRERCLADGANAYLSKPVSLPTLVKTITSVLDQAVVSSTKR